MKTGTVVLLYSWTITLWKTWQLSLSTFILRSRYLYSLQNSISVYCSPIHCLGWLPAHDWKIKLIDDLLLHLEKQKKNMHSLGAYFSVSFHGWIHIFRTKIRFPLMFDYSYSKQTIIKFPTNSRIFFVPKWFIYLGYKSSSFFSVDVENSSNSYSKSEILFDAENDHDIYKAFNLQ